MVSVTLKISSKQEIRDCMILKAHNHLFILVPLYGLFMSEYTQEVSLLTKFHSLLRN